MNAQDFNFAPTFSKNNVFSVPYRSMYKHFTTKRFSDSPKFGEGEGNYPSAPSLPTVPTTPLIGCLHDRANIELDQASLLEPGSNVGPGLGS